MDNFEHEINCPENKGIKKFLWCDYFHDSMLIDISFYKRSRETVIALESFYDMEEAWQKLKGDYDSRLKHIEANKDMFIYYLAFTGVRYFHIDRLMECSDYINGRFKDSALLKKFQAEQNKRLYHFRIKFADGYGDLIFSGFKIRKKQGNVNYTPFDGVSYQTKRIILLDSSTEINTAATGEDFDRVLAMQSLYQAGDKRLLEIARQNLVMNAGYEDSLFYSVYLLGKLGDKSDIIKLMEIYSSIEVFLISQSFCQYYDVLIKRNILDSIEDIEYRERKQLKDQTKML